MISLFIDAVGLYLLYRFWNRPFWRTAIIWILCSSGVRELPTLYNAFSNAGFISMNNSLFMEIGVYFYIIVAFRSLPGVRRAIQVLSFMAEIYFVGGWYLRYRAEGEQMTSRNQCLQEMNKWEYSVPGQLTVQNNIIPLLYSDSTSYPAIQHCLRMLGPHLSLPQVGHIEDMDYKDHITLTSIHLACVFETFHRNVEETASIPCLPMILRSIEHMKKHMYDWENCRTSENKEKECPDFSTFFLAYVEDLTKTHPIDGMFLARLKGIY